MTGSAPSSLSAAPTFQLMFYFEDFSQSGQILIEGSIIHLSDQMILMFVWYLDFFPEYHENRNCLSTRDEKKEYPVNKKDKTSYLTLPLLRELHICRLIDCYQRLRKRTAKVP